MKLKIKDLHPNPFKKYINGGQLRDERLEVLQESYDMGTLPSNFRARKNNNIFELGSGHHRLEVIKKNKGKNYEVDCELVTFSDELMLLELIRENASQRDTEFHELMDSIVLARDWLQSDSNGVKRFNDVKNNLKGKKGFQSITKPDSYKSVADFISKNGKTISYGSIKNYLDAHDKVSPKILSKVIRAKNKEDKKENVTASQVFMISSLSTHQEQEKILEIIKEKPNIDRDDMKKLINIYKVAEPEIKAKVLKKEIPLEDVGEITFNLNTEKYKNIPKKEQIRILEDTKVYDDIIKGLRYD